MCMCVEFSPKESLNSLQFLLSTPRVPFIFSPISCYSSISQFREFSSLWSIFFFLYFFSLYPCNQNERICVRLFFLPWNPRQISSLYWPFVPVYCKYLRLYVVLMSFIVQKQLPSIASHPQCLRAFSLKYSWMTKGRERPTHWHIPPRKQTKKLNAVPNFIATYSHYLVDFIKLTHLYGRRCKYLFYPLWCVFSEFKRRRLQQVI